MAQIPLLIDIVKKQLKAQGKTYVDVAHCLALSEASVKRLFVEHNFTIQRLESIAELLGYELSELMQLVATQQQQLTVLSIQQEQEIANDMILLLVTVCVINGYTMSDILDRFTIDELECIRKLAKLDRLNIIELLPNNRVKLLTSPNFAWISRGPIQTLFQQKLQQDFFNSSFAKETEKLNVMNGVLSDHSMKVIQQKMQRLSEEFNNLIQEDKKVPIKEKTGVTIVLAKRHWEYSMFEHFRK